MRILLVSGGVSLTRQVMAALPTDADVLEVRTPQRGLAVIDEGEHTFDVIVADADTHPTGGFFMVREVVSRKTDGVDLPPVVLLIARPQDEYLSRWAQADAWVVKPVDPFDLAEVLQAFTDGAEVPALPGVTALGHPPRLGPGGGVNADRTLIGGRPPLEALGHRSPDGADPAGDTTGDAQGGPESLPGGDGAADADPADSPFEPSAPSDGRDQRGRGD